MNKGILIVLSGLPASGKSTFAEKVKNEYDNVVIISSDAIRKEKFGDESIQYDETIAKRRLQMKGVDISAMNDQELEKAMRAACGSLVFGKMNYRTENALRNGKTVIYDSTNITPAARKKILRKFSGLYRKSVCCDFVIPYDTLVKRDAERTRTVGVDVIDRMAKDFKHVTEEEGFDIIHIVQ